MVMLFIGETVVLFIGLCFVCVLDHTYALNPTIVTGNGYATGQVSSNQEVIVFSNIGYAAPPVGINRFRPPQPITSWSNRLYANSTFPVMCPQLVPTLNNFLIGQEDCLYLDVYSPVNATKDSQLPVFYWIYGGGFIIGDKSFAGQYDATNLVSQHGYVVVIANYRLGVLGLMVTDELRAENGDGSAGNMGLRDQRAAMQWIQNNIAVFGGNPNHITVGGESAGAWSVCFHLASPASKGLFVAAIVQSASSDSPYAKYENIRAYSEAYSVQAGCSSTDRKANLQCMRQKTVAELLAPMIITNWTSNANYTSLTGWTMVIDFSNEGLFGTPYASIMHGEWANVNVLTGFVNDEGAFFLPTFPSTIPGITSDWTDADIMLLVNHYYQNNTLAQQALSVYPLSDYVDAKDRADKLFRDIQFACPARRLSFAISAQTAATGVASWLYHFDYTDAFIPVATHASELNFVFDTQLPFSGNDIVVVDSFGNYWSNYIWTSDPNGNAAHYENRQSNPSWPQSSPNTKMNMKISAPTVLESAYISEQCDFWDQTVSLDFGNSSSVSTCYRQFDNQCVGNSKQCAANSLLASADSTTSDLYNQMMCGCMQAQYACQSSSGCYVGGTGLAGLIAKTTNYCGADAAFTFNCLVANADNITNRTTRTPGGNTAMTSSAADGSIKTIGTLFLDGAILIMVLMHIIKYID